MTSCFRESHVCSVCFGVSPCVPVPASLLSSALDSCPTTAADHMPELSPRLCHPNLGPPVGLPVAAGAAKKFPDKTNISRSSSFQSDVAKPEQLTDNVQVCDQDAGGTRSAASFIRSYKPQPLLVLSRWMGTPNNAKVT